MARWPLRMSEVPRLSQACRICKVRHYKKPQPRRLPPTRSKLIKLISNRGAENKNQAHRVSKKQMNEACVPPMAHKSCAAADRTLQDFNKHERDAAAVTLTVGIFIHSEFRFVSFAACEGCTEQSGWFGQIDFSCRRIIAQMTEHDLVPRTIFI